MKVNHDELLSARLRYVTTRELAPCRQSDGAVAICRDAENGVDGTQTGGVVDRQPQIAQSHAEWPILAGEQVDGVERH